MRNASITAGVGLLLMSALAGFGKFIALDGLVTPGNAARTATAIMASDGLFRLGIVSLFLVVALDVVVAWALYRVFSPVNSAISMLAACFRLVFAGVFMVAIGQLVGVLRLLSDDGYLAVFSTDQLHARALLGVNAFGDIWDAGLVLFGLHLLVVGYLAYRSGYVPRFLGALLAIAGFGYAFDSLVAVLSASPSIKIGTFTFIGEFLLALWLVIWGRRLTASEPGFQEDHPAVAR
ncbi:MAG: DUF4386 family protein [Pseudonocardiaceae bacterium]|nr:DUF4386 family protein [Pseudonocardiaceae bacterium]